MAHNLLKMGMNEVGEINSDSIKTPSVLIRQLLTTNALLLAIPLYAVSSIGWLIVLSRMNLSVGSPFLASLYIFCPYYQWFTGLLKLIRLYLCSIWDSEAFTLISNSNVLAS